MSNSKKPLTREEISKLLEEDDDPEDLVPSDDDDIGDIAIPGEASESEDGFTSDEADSVVLSHVTACLTRLHL
jgi:hypothetical protein